MKRQGDHEQDDAEQSDDQRGYISLRLISSTYVYSTAPVSLPINDYAGRIIGVGSREVRIDIAIGDSTTIISHGRQVFGDGAYRSGSWKCVPYCWVEEFKQY